MALSFNSFKCHLFSSWKLVCNRVYCLLGLVFLVFIFPLTEGRQLSFWNSRGPHWLGPSSHGTVGSPNFRVLIEKELPSISSIFDLRSNVNYFIKINIWFFTLSSVLDCIVSSEIKAKSFAIFKGDLCSKECISFFSEFLFANVNTPLSPRKWRSEIVASLKILYMFLMLNFSSILKNAYLVLLIYLHLSLHYSLIVKANMYLGFLHLLSESAAQEMNLHEALIERLLWKQSLQSMYSKVSGWKASFTAFLCPLQTCLHRQNHILGLICVVACQLSS